MELGAWADGEPRVMQQMEEEVVQSPRSWFLSLPGIAVALLFWSGLFYWYWLAYELGSWGMFFVTLIPPATVIAVLTGAWSIVFGMPEWVFGIFG